MNYISWIRIERGGRFNWVVTVKRESARTRVYNITDPSIKRINRVLATVGDIHVELRNDGKLTIEAYPYHN